MPAVTRSVPAGTRRVPTGTRSVPTGTRSVPAVTRSVPAGTRRVPAVTRSVPTGTRRVPAGTRSVPTVTRSVPTGTRRVPAVTRSMRASLASVIVRQRCQGGGVATSRVLSRGAQSGLKEVPFSSVPSFFTQRDEPTSPRSCLPRDLRCSPDSLTTNAPRVIGGPKFCGGICCPKRTSKSPGLGSPPAM